MNRAKTAFNWRTGRGFALAACLAGCLVAGSLARAQGAAAAQAKAQAVPDSQAKAQDAPVTPRPAPNFRLLNAKEERSIVAAAKDQEQTGSDAQDCSHLVHQTYLDAGFEYPYASSRELYAGTENFLRVRRPRAGDLIVWPGHVGIVLDPIEHSFYSLVSTGLEAQDYLGPYWTARGRPRFYRYKVENGRILTATVRAPAEPRPLNSKMAHETAPLIEERSPMATTSNRVAKTASDRTRVEPRADNNPPAASAAGAVSSTFDARKSIVIAAGSKQPTSSQVADAIADLTNGSGEVLRADDSLKLILPVVIFERIEVERLEFKRNHGWATLRIDSRATIAGGETDYKRRREKVRWELRRAASGWEVSTSIDRIYVPNDVAVRSLAAQLARLTESDDAAAHRETVLRKESQLANLLSALLENKPATYRAAEGSGSTAKLQAGEKN
jgi:hypothetical protein